MAPTAAAAVATWEAVIAALEGLSDGVVWDHGPLPLLKVSDVVFGRCKVAILTMQALPKLTQGTWETIIKNKVRLGSIQCNLLCDRTPCHC